MIRRLNWVIIIIASRAQERAPVDTESGYRVIKDLEDGISWVARREGTTRWVQIAWQLSPMGTTDGAGDTTMADIGGDAGKVECMGALGREYSLPRALSLAMVTQRV